MNIRDIIITGKSSKLPGDFAKQEPTKPTKRAPFKPIPANIAPLLPHDGVAEFYFHPTRNFRADFAWPQHHILLEIDGGIYGRGKPCPTCGRKAVGAHTSIQRLKSDHVKLNEAAILGWVVLRQTPEQLESGEAGALVARAIQTKMRESAKDAT